MPTNTYAISAIKKIIKADGNIVEEYAISALFTDSRRINNPAEGLFFALSVRRNGHEFVAEAYAGGAAQFCGRTWPGV
ncbi:hypothetical protein ACFJIV_05925 [Mucilaginibacter sp. UC70_90]